jgi:hypothetical protein
VGYEVQASPQLTALPSIQRWQTQANKLVRLKLFTSDVGRALIESLNRTVGSAVFGHDETVASGEASEETRRRAEERRAIKVKRHDGQAACEPGGGGSGGVPVHPARLHAHSTSPAQALLTIWIYTC